MKKFAGRLGAAMIALGAVFALVVFTWPGPASTDESGGFIDPSEIKPGMKGYGLSVFAGDQIERFEVEVVDVVPNFITRQDIILAICTGQNLEKTKIVAGMSGSPVWIEGRLAGAVAYGWSFSDDPLAGITPIKYMNEAMRSPSLAQAPAAAYPALARVTTSPAATGMSLRPIATPLLVSGVSLAGLAELQRELAPFNLAPMAGGGLGSATLDRSAIDGMVPGSAVGGALMLGEVSLVGIGTLTWREGNRISAFGHPFLQGGAISMPMVSAKIHAIVSTQDVSFKLGTPLAVVGELIGDEQACIVGELGREPPMLPLEVRVRNAKTGVDETFHFQQAMIPELAPVLFKIAIMESIMRVSPSLEPLSVRATTRLSIAGHGDAVYEDVYLARRQNFSLGFLEPVLFFMSNPFEKVKFEKATVEIEIADDLKAANIDSVWVSSDQVRPGDTVTVKVALRPYNGAVEEYSFEVAVPNDPDLKNLVLTIAGGNRTPPDAAYPRSVDDMIAFLDQVHGSDDLLVFYKVPGGGVDIGGKRLPSLPPSVSSVLQPGNSTAARPAPSTVYISQRTPYVIFGAQRVKIKVDGGGQATKKRR